MIYLIILFLLLFLSFRYDYLKKMEGKNLWFIVIFLIFVFLAGLRYRVGSDTLMYIKSYAKLHPINLLTLQDLRETRFAPGYVILTSIFKAITPDFTLFQIFHALIVNSVVFWFIKKNTRNIFFALFLFYIFLYLLFCFQQMRESLAVSVFLLAWPAFKEGKWLWWYLAACLAVTFHISAFIMFILPVIGFPGIRQLFVFGWRTPVICLIILVFGFVIQTVFFKYIEAVAITESMMERATAYDKSSIGSASFNINNLIGKSIQWLIYPILAMACIFGNKFKHQGFLSLIGGKKIEMMAIMSLYVTAFAVAIPIMGRYNNYFFIFLIIILSDWIFSYIPVSGKKLKLGFFSWIIFFLPMLALQIGGYFAPVNKSGTLNNYMIYHPYNSYFDQERNLEREKAIRYIFKKL